MEVDTGNRRRLIMFGDTAARTPVLFLFVIILLVINVQSAMAAPSAKPGIKGGDSVVKKREPKPEELLIVQLKKGADRDDFDSLLKEVNGTLIKTISMGSQLEFLIVATEPGTTDDTFKKLSANTDISSVRRNNKYSVQQAVPNDSLFSTQWDLSFMKYAQARGLGYGGQTPLMFYVIDTGLGPIGYELGQVAQQYNFSDTIPTGNKEHLHDGFGHGTAVSTVAASTDNLLGYAGQSNFFFNRTQEVMCRITQQGQGSTSTVNILAAIQFCWEQMFYAHMPNGPVNLSFGSPPPNTLNADPSIQQMAAGLRQVGSVLVLASGNDSQVDMSPELFARRVGAIDQNGNLASFSDTGPFVTAAPGVQVPVYIPYSYILPFFSDGTSFAAPRWCGAILACMGAMSNKSASLADQIVFDTATVTSQGQRVPNMFAALQEAAKH